MQQKRHKEDAVWMDRALALAARAYGCTSPNPMVGAVVVVGEAVAGEGFHARAGEPHAEPLAIERAGRMLAPNPPPDVTLYVNLEPCAHHGRTPPCTAAILAAGIPRVVVAILDPDARVAGNGIEILRAHGVEVEVGCRAGAARELNHLFLRRQGRGRPFVALKVARASDGSVAAADGSPVAITGEMARAHVHRLRAGHDAILIGVETLRRDRPRLDIRLYSGPGRAPRRVVIDPRLRADPAWLWPGEAVRPVVLTSAAARAARGRDFDAVADLVPLPQRPDGTLDVAAIPAALAQLDLWSVLVEGGGRTHRSFLEAGLWDRMYVYSRPGPGIAGLAWEAEASWKAATTVALYTETLGVDRLEIFEPGQD